MSSLTTRRTRKDVIRKIASLNYDAVLDGLSFKIKGASEI